MLFNKICNCTTLFAHLVYVLFYYMYIAQPHEDRLVEDHEERLHEDRLVEDYKERLHWLVARRTAMNASMEQ